MLIGRSVPSPLPILSFPHSLPLPLSAQLPPPRCPPPQVWLGAFPIVINYWAALSITVYYAATLLLMYYTRALSHLTSMWFSAITICSAMRAITLRASVSLLPSRQ